MKPDKTGSAAQAPGLLSDSQRQDILAKEVRRYVKRGWRVEAHSATQAVVVKGKRPNHTLHLLLTIFTVTMWGLVWLFLAATRWEKRTVITVDQTGKIRRS